MRVRPQFEKKLTVFDCSIDESTEIKPSERKAALDSIYVNSITEEESRDTIW